MNFLISLMNNEDAIKENRPEKNILKKIIALLSDS